MLIKRVSCCKKQKNYIYNYIKEKLVLKQRRREKNNVYIKEKLMLKQGRREKRRKKYIKEKLMLKQRRREKKKKKLKKQYTSRSKKKSTEIRDTSK